MNVCRTFAVGVLATTVALSEYVASAEVAGPIYDIVVYGDSSGAVTAAIAASREVGYGLYRERY